MELLCAMAILIIIVLMMSVIFTESDRSWTLGTNRVMNNASGRAMLDMIAHDLQYAVADNYLTFRMGQDRGDNGGCYKTYNFINSEICMVSLEDDAAVASTQAEQRTACEVCYYVTQMTIPPTGTRFKEGIGPPI